MNRGRSLAARYCPYYNHLPAVGMGELGLVEDSPTAIRPRLDAVRADMTSKWERLSVALSRWEAVARVGDFSASVVANLAAVWKKETIWVDVANKISQCRVNYAVKVGDWKAQNAIMRLLDPNKPEDLEQLRTYLKEGKALVDAMDTFESVIAVNVKDAVIMLAGGVLPVAIKRIAQITVSKLRRPVAAVSRGTVATGKAVGTAAVAAGKFVGQTAYNVGSGTLGLITFVSKYGVPIIAVGAALYFLAPLIAPVAGATIGGYKRGRGAS